MKLYPTLCVLVLLPAPPGVALAQPVSQPARQPIPVAAERLPPSTILVTDEVSLRAAAARTRRASLNILIDRPITVNHVVFFPDSRSIVRLIGVSKQAAIRFNMIFDGNWNRFRGENGLEFHCRQAILRGIELSGYEYLGCAVKAHVTELLDVSDCTFREIGTRQFPHKVDPPTTASDTLYNQCIAAPKIRDGHVSVVNCRFYQCAQNNYSWSHCVYVSARSVLIVGNDFEKCGNPFAVGGYVAEASNNIFGNEVTDPWEVRDRWGVKRPTYLGELDVEDRTAFMFNRISGRHHHAWYAHLDPQRQLVDFNDYSGMAYTGYWAAAVTRKRRLSWDQWRELRHDNHSMAPEDQSKTKQ